MTNSATSPDGAENRDETPTPINQDEHSMVDSKEQGEYSDVELEIPEQEPVERNGGIAKKVELAPAVNGKNVKLTLCPACENIQRIGNSKPNYIEANGKQDEAEKNFIKYGFIRHLIAILSLSSIVLANANRQAFNQALTGMVRVEKVYELPAFSEAPNENSTYPATLIPTHSVTTESPMTTSFVSLSPELGQHSTTSTLIDANATSDEANIEEFDDRYDWTPDQIALLQAAFSYGYTPFMILGGRLSELYGAKWVVFASGFGSALCCLSAPFFADTGYYLLVLSRVLMGLSQTGVSPALYAVMSRWLPSEESNLYLPMIKVAVQIGFMLGSLVSGFLPWRLTFYAVGCIGLLWSVLWVFAASSEPSGNRFISKKELQYIHQEIEKQRVKSDDDDDSSKTKKKSAPWLAIFTNPIVLAFMFAKFTVKLSTDTQSMQIPYYISKVFNVSKELNGTLTAMNFAIQGIFTGLIAYMAKEFVVRKTFGLGKTGVRRLFQGVCNFGGEPLTPIDLSIEFSASIMAIANTTANVSGIILPQIVSLVLGGEPTSSARWNIVLMIVAGIITAGGALYCYVVKAEIQDFSKKPSRKNKQEFELEIESKE